MPESYGVVAAGSLAGLGVGLALLLIWSGYRRSRPTLAARVAAYLPDAERPVSGGDAAPARGPLAVVRRLTDPWLADAGRLLERLGSTSASIRSRLEVAGSPAAVEQVRIEQVAWSGIGLAAGLTAALTLGAPRGAPAPVLALFVAVCALSGALARDRWLTRCARLRRERLEQQLPVLAELLALAVSAGEGAVGALARVTGLAGGDLAGELRRTLDEARSGSSLGVALPRLADRTGAPAVRRFADGVAVAVERGTPLADVLRAQSADARANRRRDLMELGGKREIAMMAPVVFLILPVTVVFALFPGLAVLQAGL